MNDDDLLVSGGQYGEVLRRRWRVVAIGAVASVALGVLAFLFVGDGASLAAAEASVEVRPVTANRFGTNTRINDLISMPTEAEVMRSTAVAERVISARGIDVSPEDLLERVEVTNPANTQVLVIEYAAASEDVAVNRAQEFAAQYLQYRTETIAANIESSIENLQSQSDATQELFAAALAAQDAATNALAETEAQARVTSLNTRLDQFESQIASLQGILVDPGAIVSNARPVVTQGAPGWITAVGLFGLGLVASVGAAIVVDRLDDKPRDETEVSQTIPAPVFGALLTTQDRGEHEDAIGGVRSAKARQTLGEYRRLRLLLDTGQEDDVDSVLVVTPIDDAAAGEVATNLVRVLVRARERTALVWCEDLRRGPLIDLGVKDAKSLDDVLSGRLRLDETLVDVPGHPGLSVVELSVGRTSSVSAGRLREVYEQLVREFDMVVTVAPAASPADTAELATFVDVAIVAVDTQRASRRAMRNVVGMLDAVGTGVKATFITRTRPWW